MDHNAMKEKITEIICDQLGVDSVDLSADLQKKYDIDSIGVLDFIMTVEETFGIQFHDEDLEKMKSVDDIISRIEALTK